MNKPCRWLLLLVLVVVGPLHAGAVRVGVSDGNADVLNLRDGRFVGMLAQRYQCVFDAVDDEFEFRRYPHARVLHSLESGEIDIGLPLVKVAERDRYAAFPRGILDVEFVLYSYREIGLDDDLSDFTFAVRRATASKDLVAARGGRYREVSSWEQAVRLAQARRFDGVVLPAIVAGGIPAERYDGLHRSLFGTIPLALYISRRSARQDELFERFDRAIADCRR